MTEHLEASRGLPLEDLAIEVGIRVRDEKGESDPTEQRDRELLEEIDVVSPGSAHRSSLQCNDG
jgi:hypothetical protein